MDAREAFVHFVYLCLAVLSLGGAWYSYISIRKLQGYEESTRKLAKWSQTVEDELIKTQTTQAAGASAIACSLATSLALLFASPWLPPWSQYCAAPIMLVTVLLARGHIANYWTPHKTSQGKKVGIKVPELPNAEGYRAAQQSTDSLLQILEYLEYSWLGACLVAGMVGYSGA